MINENGKIAPAPWVPFTRDGCDVGEVATANTILENTGIDIPSFFGPGLARGDPGERRQPRRVGDADVCRLRRHRRPLRPGLGDLLRLDPRACRPAAGRAGRLQRVQRPHGREVRRPRDPAERADDGPDGNVIQDQNGHVGFPGFDGMEANVSLSWVAQMQEAGIPVTYAYISDAHDAHGTSGNIHFAYGPGEAGYAQQLHDYDHAFEQFFNRLAADGINKSNTLFLFTVDEGDHFVGDQPTPGGLRRRHHAVQLQPRRARSTRTCGGWS